MHDTAKDAEKNRREANAELPLPSQAVQFSRAYAAASPHLSKVAREHIEGLCSVIEAMMQRSSRAAVLAGESETQRWQMHIAGPDDVHVIDGELEALRYANRVNLTYLADRMKNPDSEVMCIATVQPDRRTVHV